MKLARTMPALALGLFLAIPAFAQHHMNSGKVDYDPDPGGGDRDVPEGCVGAANKVQITGNQVSFAPSTITIEVGQPVCWTWSTGNTSHNVKGNDGSFTSGPPASTGTFQRTFTEAGTFGFHCQVHGSPTSGMRGTVIVQEAGAVSGPGTIAVNPEASTVDESAGSVVLNIERTGGTDGKVTVKVATGTGSAAKGKDFLPRTAVLTWNPGDGEAKPFAVTIKQDTALEQDETFPVLLSKVTGGAALGAASSTITIHDDDTPSCSPAALLAPSGVKAVGRSTGEVLVSWGADSSVAREVRIERRMESGAFREIAAVPAGALRFVDGGLDAGTTYQYRLRAVGVDGTSSWSEIVAGATDGGTGACAAGTLCLGDGRFEAKVSYRSADGAPLRAAQSIEVGPARRSGLFAFAQGTAPDGELQGILNVLDGCAVNDHFWVYLAAVTDLELDVAVRDTQTGRTWAFHNPAGKAADVVRDVDAFRTCP